MKKSFGRIKQGWKSLKQLQQVLMLGTTIGSLWTAHEILE